MRSTDRPDTDEAYSEDYEDPYYDDYEGPYDDDDTYGDDYEDRGYWALGWWPIGWWPGTDADDETVGEEDGTWLDEGLITLLLVAGVVLFLFPEPATSAVGILLLLTGGVLWLLDWLI